MSLLDYRKLLAEQWRVWVGGIVLGLLTAAVLAFLLPTRYASSTALFFVAPSSSADLAAAYDGVQLATEKAKNYASLATQDRLSDTVAARLGPGVDADAVAGGLTAAAEPTTPLLTITTTASTPDGAQAFARAVADTLVEQVTQLESPQIAPGSSGQPDVSARVVQPATFSDDPVSMSVPQRLLLGGAIGVAVGVLAVLVRHATDGSLRSRAALERAVGARVLAVVGYDRSARRHPVIADREGLDGPGVEGYRQLRTALVHGAAGPAHGVLVLTGMRAGDGVSSVVANLAIVLARSGRSVLVVDANLRRPRVHTLLGVDPGAGLCAVLTAASTLRHAVAHGSEHRVAVLPSGDLPPDPTDLLGGAAMGRVLEEAARCYDIVLVDAPPSGAVPDAAVVAGGQHRVLLVVRHGHATAEDVERATGTLGAVGVRAITGVVLTMSTDRGRRTAYSSSTSSLPPDRSIPASAASTPDREPPGPSSAPPQVRRPGPSTRKPVDPDGGQEEGGAAVAES